MHALKKPLLHRDLKVSYHSMTFDGADSKIENVLSSPSGQPPSPQRPTPLTFKLCDFGSTTYPATSPPSTKLQSDALALDLNKHTTLQYRSPEMVEPMLGLAVGLPSGESILEWVGLIVRRMGARCSTVQIVLLYDAV